MSKKKNIVEIDVKKWGRNSMHNDETGRYCAMGFAQAQGVKIPAMGVSKGSSFACEMLKNGVGMNYSWQPTIGNIEGLIICVNDDEKFRGKKRRTLLTKLFAFAGIKLKFKNL